MIGILGAGALGRLWAALLPPGQVCYLPRPEQPAPSPLHYVLHTPEQHTRAVTLPPLADASALTLLLVTTKAGDALPAVTAWLPKIPPRVPVVLFQNGLGSQQAVAEHFPERPLLAASTTEGANRPDAATLIHAGRGETWIGALTEAGRPLLEDSVRILSASGLVLHATEHIHERLWQKLLINAGINPFTAILNCRNGELLDAPLFRRHIRPLCAEIAALMAAAGVAHPGAEELQAQIEAVARRTAANTSSMLADVRQGRKTEIDYINGYLVRLGSELGIPTPVNRMLTERIRQLSPH